MSGSIPNIAMGFRPTPNVGTVYDPTVQIDAAQKALQLKTQQDQFDRQNALMGIFRDPKSLDGTGNPTPDTLQKVMAVDPQAGISLRQNMMIGQEHKLRTEALSSKLMSDKIDMISEAAAPIMETYETEIKAGVPEPQARRNAQASLVRANQRLQTSGIFNEEDAKRFPTEFDPIQMRNVVAGTKQYQEWLKQNRADTEEQRKQRHDDDTNYNKGTSLTQDSEGNPITYRPNAPPGQQFIGADGKPVPPEKLKNLSKVSAPGSAATRDRNDIEFTTRNKYEGELGHPVATEDEQAELKNRILKAEADRKVDTAGREAGAKRDATAKPIDVIVNGQPQQVLWKDQKYVNLDGSPVTGDVRSAKAATPAAAAERDAMTVADSRIKAAEQQRGAPLSDEEKAEVRRTARSDPKVQEAIRKSEGTAIEDDAADLIAAETLRGDFHGTVGMGRNQASMRKIANARARLAKEQGLTGADLAANTAEFIGITSAERVLGTRGAGIDLGISEAQKFAPMVLAASDSIDRTKFPTVNAMQLAIQKGTGGENVIRLIDAMNAYKMAYTQILTRGGMPTDDARRRSDEIIDQAWSNGQIRVAIDQLSKEMAAAQSAVPAVRDNLYTALTGKKRNTQPEPQQQQGGGQQGQATPAVQIPPSLASVDKAGKLAHNADGTVFYDTGTKKFYDKTGKETAAPQQTAPATPTYTPPATPPKAAEGHPVPEQYANVPDGKTFTSKSTGQKFVKRDGKIYPVEAGNDDALKQAKEAIRLGAPRDAVIKRLKDAGIDTKGL